MIFSPTRTERVTVVFRLKLRAAMTGYASIMNSPFSWHWDYDRGETLADAVIHILGIALAIGGAVALFVNTARHGNLDAVRRGHDLSGGLAGGDVRIFGGL